MVSAVGCAWVLTECGQVSALPAGNPASDVLFTGPVYELQVRAQPAAKLLFTHTPTANVNETASALAGQTVKGDACLVVHPCAAVGAASPAVLLEDFLRCAPNPPQCTLRQSSFQAGKCAAALASALSARSALVTPPPASARFCCSAPPAPGQGQEQWPQASIAAEHECRNAGPRPRRCSHTLQRHLAMRDILRSRNAPTAGGSGGSCGLACSPPGGASAPCEVGPSSSPAGEQSSAHAAATCGLPPGRTLVAPWVDAERRPAKSARSSRDYCEPGSAAGASSSSLAAAATEAFASNAAAEATPSAPHALGGPSHVPQPVTGGGHVGSSAVPGAPCACPAAGGAADGLGKAGPALHREVVVAAAEQRNSTCGGGSDCGGDSVAVAVAAGAPAADAASVDMPWADLACDVVACIAMQLPEQASQAVAMASVCRGWRAAILGHAPVLRRLTFWLDPTRPLRPRSNGGDGAGSGGSSAASNGGSHCASAPSAYPCAARLASPRSPHGQPPARSALSRDEREQAAMAAVLARQYAAGAFVLPSNSRLQQAGREQAHGCDAEAAAVAVPRVAVAALPRLLVEAAHASNPSAQLVMAQLLEGCGDAGLALRWWRKLAQGGDPMGTFKLGLACYDGSHGLEPDPEAAHMWLGRTVRHLLRVDSLAAIPLEDRRSCLAADAGAGGGVAAPAGAPPEAGRRQRGVAGASSGLTAQVRALDPPLLCMLGWSAIVLGYLEFDGVAGPASWGMGDRSAAVRMFRLAEACGVAEASATLGWLFNTGQY